MKIEGRLIIDLMRGCLTEMSNSLRDLRREAEREAPESFPVSRNALLFSLDMNLAAMHMAGLKLAEGVEAGEVSLADAERVIIGMSATFMREAIARLVDEALEGQAMPDERVRRALGPDAPQGGPAVH